MRPDIDFLKSRFEHFNRTIFKSSLLTPQVGLTDSNKRLGQLDYCVVRINGKETIDNFVLKLSRRFARNQRALEDTLIHEMIHLLIHSNCYHDTAPHGKLFRAVMDKINRKHGRSITITTRISTEEHNSDTTRRYHNVCVVRLTDGRVGVACIRQVMTPRLYIIKEKELLDEALDSPLTDRIMPVDE